MSLWLRRGQGIQPRLTCVAAAAAGRAGTPVQEQDAAAKGSLTPDVPLPLRPRFFTPKRSRQGPEAEERIDQLARPKSAYWQRCSDRLKEKEELELEECTFQPKTGRPPEHPPYDAAGDLPASERLFRVAEVWERRRQQRKAAQEDAEVAGLDFKPQRAASADRRLPDNYKPIHERVDEVIRQQKQSLARKAQEAAPQLTFQPAISARSVRLLEERELRDDLELNEAMARGSTGASVLLHTDQRAMLRRSRRAPLLRLHPIPDRMRLFLPISARPGNRFGRAGGSLTACSYEWIES